MKITIFSRLKFLLRSVKDCCLLLMLCFLGSISQPIKSAEFDPTLQFKGFGSIGLSGSDSQNLEFRRDFTQEQGITNNVGFDLDSRLGLQLDLNINKHWHMGVQWIARNHVGDFIEQNLDWAYLKWSPNINTDIRIGRLGVDIFLLSDYRNVGYAYPWIRPPHEFYASLPIYHFDGADISQRFNLGEGIFTIKVLGGYSSFNLFGDIGMTDEYAMGFAGVNLLYDLDDWKFKLAYIWNKGLENPETIQRLNQVVNNPTLSAVWPDFRSMVNLLNFEEANLHYASFGMGYDNGEWLLQFESSYVNSDFAGYLDLFSGYFNVGRRFDKLTLYTLFGIAESLDQRVNVSNPLLAIPQVTQIRDGIDRSLNAGVDQISVSLGMRYDVYKNIALKAQWSHFWLGKNGKNFWIEPEEGTTPKTVNLWSLGIDFIF